MTIAGAIIHKLGGVQKVSEITGLSVSQIYRWTWPKERGGTDGLVPACWQQTLLDYANDNGLPLAPEDFFRSATIPSGDKVTTHTKHSGEAVQSSQRESRGANRARGAA